eukprot:CAMPEP_0171210690 /NCGR_PEP_ID=MMETSP0790-20130122/29241_1 /TAXON_ID=2925 /ORGANISM="Alexandrium catenella, Strain OF101" /LENGTH=92 /DNA_ID=CAMNT_0011676339 /DNA_START=466 /DNA_END=741 /DNA_ORIENTATION=-
MSWGFPMQRSNNSPLWPHLGRALATTGTGERLRFSAVCSGCTPILSSGEDCTRQDNDPDCNPPTLLFIHMTPLPCWGLEAVFLASSAISVVC